jgi:hypothetical protein
METKIQKKTKMKFRTCFSSVSHYGYKLDILKSAIQKYLRRKEKSKMVWCVAEIYLFQMWANTDEQKRATKGIITNLLNRLIVMMDEELLFADVKKYLVLRKLLEKFEEDNRNDFTYLYTICDVLINSRILRLNSDIRAYWDHRFRFDGEVYKNDDLKVVDDDASYKCFVKEFEDGSYGCYYYMFKIFNGCRETPGIKWFKTKKENVYKIWYYLFNRKVVLENWMLCRTLEYKLGEFHKKRGERFMWLSSAIQIVLNAKKLGFDTYMTEQQGRQFVNDELKNVLPKCREYRDKIMQKVFENRRMLHIDDYCIDQHCSQGRKIGKGKKDWKTIGSLVVNEDKEYFVKDWRDYYRGEFKTIAEHEENRLGSVLDKIEHTSEKKAEKKVVKLVYRKVDKTANKRLDHIQNEQCKKNKSKKRKADFNDLEIYLKTIETVDASAIILCSDVTCGNKVMCFEYKGKIWKESRKSMFYNRDYCVIDDCKELFGLKTIGIERVLTDFRIVKIDKTKKSWKNNWHKVVIGSHEEPVVYCIMNKVEYYTINKTVDLSGIKKNFDTNRSYLKEFIKIGVFRGIFRCSDFNCRNVLVGLDKEDRNEYFVSIDEGDIGKRLDIIGKREAWVIKMLNKDKTIINEVIEELKKTDSRVRIVQDKMREYKFNQELIEKVIQNWNNMRSDLMNEGVLFD